MFPKDQKIPRLIDDSGDPSIEGKGRFVPGTQAIFFFHFHDLDGELYDPSQIDLSIQDSDGTEAESVDQLDRIDLGEYAYKWSIPSTATPGVYALVVSYTAETGDGPESKSYTENFVINDATTTATELAVNRQVLALRGMVESLIGYAQRIPAWREEVRFDSTRSLGRVSFGRWNQPSGVRVYRNHKLIDDGYILDYYNGEINFLNPLTEYDFVQMDYNFRWFSDDEIDQFIYMGLREVNLQPPHTRYTLINLTQRANDWIVAVVYSATVNLLRRWLMDLNFQEPTKIFGGVERANQIASNMESLKKNYEESLKQLYEQKKKGPYVGLTVTITQPVWTLPGGRSRWFRYLFG